MYMYISQQRTFPSSLSFYSSSAMWHQRCSSQVVGRGRGGVEYSNEPLCGNEYHSKNSSRYMVTNTNDILDTTTGKVGPLENDIAISSGIRQQQRRFTVFLQQFVFLNSPISSCALPTYSRSSLLSANGGEHKYIHNTRPGSRPLCVAPFRPRCGGPRPFRTYVMILTLLLLLLPPLLERQNLPTCRILEEPQVLSSWLPSTLRHSEQQSPHFRPLLLVLVPAQAHIHSAPERFSSFNPPNLPQPISFSAWLHRTVSLLFYSLRMRSAPLLSSLSLYGLGPSELRPHGPWSYFDSNSSNESSNRNSTTFIHIFNSTSPLNRSARDSKTHDPTSDSSSNCRSGSRGNGICSGTSNDSTSSRSIETGSTSENSEHSERSNLLLAVLRWATTVVSDWLASLHATESRQVPHAAAVSSPASKTAAAILPAGTEGIVQPLATSEGKPVENELSAAPVTEETATTAKNRMTDVKIIRCEEGSSMVLTAPATAAQQQTRLSNAPSHVFRSLFCRPSLFSRWRKLHRNYNQSISTVVTATAQCTRFNSSASARRLRASSAQPSSPPAAAAARSSPSTKIQPLSLTAPTHFSETAAVPYHFSSSSFSSIEADAPQAAVGLSSLASAAERGKRGGSAGTAGDLPESTADTPPLQPGPQKKKIRRQQQRPPQQHGGKQQQQKQQVYHRKSEREHQRQHGLLQQRRWRANHMRERVVAHPKRRSDMQARSATNSTPYTTSTSASSTAHPPVFVLPFVSVPLSKPSVPSESPSAPSESLSPSSILTTADAVKKKRTLWAGMVSGFALTVAAEIGDRTFFLAAVLSAKHRRSVVFAATCAALFLAAAPASLLGALVQHTSFSRDSSLSWLRTFHGSNSSPTASSNRSTSNSKSNVGNGDDRDAVTGRANNSGNSCNSSSGDSNKASSSETSSNSKEHSSNNTEQTSHTNKEKTRPKIAETERDSTWSIVSLLSGGLFLFFGCIHLKKCWQWPPAPSPTLCESDHQDAQQGENSQRERHQGRHEESRRENLQPTEAHQDQLQQRERQGEHSRKRDPTQQKRHEKVENKQKRLTRSTVEMLEPLRKGLDGEQLVHEYVLPRDHVGWSPALQREEQLQPIEQQKQIHQQQGNQAQQQIRQQLQQQIQQQQPIQQHKQQLQQQQPSKEQYKSIEEQYQSNEEEHQSSEEPHQSREEQQQASKEQLQGSEEQWGVQRKDSPVQWRRLCEGLRQHCDECERLHDKQKSSSALFCSVSSDDGDDTSNAQTCSSKGEGSRRRGSTSKQARSLSAFMRVYNSCSSIGRRNNREFVSYGSTRSEPIYFYEGEQRATDSAAATAPRPAFHRVSTAAQKSSTIPPPLSSSLFSLSSVFPSSSSQQSFKPTVLKPLFISVPAELSHLPCDVLPSVAAAASAPATPFCSRDTPIKCAAATSDDTEKDKEEGTTETAAVLAASDCCWSLPIDESAPAMDSCTACSCLYGAPTRDSCSCTSKGLRDSSRSSSCKSSISDDDRRKRTTTRSTCVATILTSSTENNDVTELEEHMKAAQEYAEQIQVCSAVVRTCTASQVLLLLLQLLSFPSRSPRRAARCTAAEIII